jgi:hypothetical protein
LTGSKFFKHAADEAQRSVSPRPWKMDDQTVTLPDLPDRARKIDEEMILVPEAA